MIRIKTGERVPGSYYRFIIDSSSSLFSGINKKYILYNKRKSFYLKKLFIILYVSKMFSAL